ncbi:hypothetical protein O181_046235 [Austropuccinia psidii MF-1]|uniref:Tc1-like transposase DDE domain-containing protein n=1 Tax=Austropuccinia psidii MF-1 TaxID=1389203 RepID=A0A9Q3DN40_9BASI|nr:hypothetical protein [Austropuccinia psidii MF-1]
MMVWGAICGPIQSELMIMPPGKQQAIDFIENVYEPGLLPFMDKLVEVSVAENCEGLTLIEDGAPIHTAMASQQWHDEHQICKLIWTPNSPDLNPIENLWFKIKYVITHLFNSKTMDELTAAVNASWESLPFDHLDSLLLSLPARMKMVLLPNARQFFLFVLKFSRYLFVLCFNMIHELIQRKDTNALFYCFKKLRCEKKNRNRL